MNVNECHTKRLLDAHFGIHKNMIGIRLEGTKIYIWFNSHKEHVEAIQKNKS